MALAWGQIPQYHSQEDALNCNKVVGKYWRKRRKIKQKITLKINSSRHVQDLKEIRTKYNKNVFIILVLN